MAKQPVESPPQTVPAQLLFDRWYESIYRYIIRTFAKFAVDVTTGKVTQQCPTASTVGAAGPAAALPATPLGYEVRSVNGVDVKFPYYSA